MAISEHTTRRTFLHHSVAATVGFLGGCSGWQKEMSPAKRPNIVFILADDMGWADVGYHDSVIQTPNVDRLAAGGVRFSRNYVMPTCTPTRVGFMTGHYPSRYGVVAPAYGQIFNGDTVTLPAALKQCGYTTHISGKWHMGSPPDWTPRKYGFDSSYGYFHGQIDPYTHHYKTGVASWHRNDEYLDEEGHATDLITDEAVRVIESSEDKPFFLYVAYSVPHYPLDEPKKWTAMYEDKIAEPSRRWFAASITHMDDGIGRIVEAVEQKGVREDTLILFVSDNGGQKTWSSKTLYHGRYADKPHTVLGDNRPLRGWKGDVYEGGIRVPALANWPGVLKPAVSEAVMHIVDWMPTLCRVAGYEASKDLHWDGTDMWPSIAGSAQPDRTLYWRAPKFSAVRSGRWKLIIQNNGENPELYDLADDPYETSDLASKYPDRVESLKGQWVRFTSRDR